jgi:hypothetical protein
MIRLIVGIFAHGVFERCGEAAGVGADVALGEEAVFVRMDELHRVFDGDDMLLLRHVDLVEHGGEGRRFTAAGRARDEDQPLFALDHLFEDRFGVEIVEGGHVDRNNTESAGDVAHRPVVVGTETPHFGQDDGEVEFIVLFELLFLFFRQQGIGHLFDQLAVENGQVEGDEFAVDPDLGLGAADEVQVRGLVGDDAF